MFSSVPSLPVGRAGLKRLRAALLAVALTCAVVPAAAAPLQADVATSAEKGFGRIVLTFKDRMVLPQYVATTSNGVLVLQFPDTVDVKVERLPTELPLYINVARRDPDGQALRIALQRQVRVNTMEAGEKLFIDLLPAAWKGAPPPLPETVIQELAARAEAALRAAREADAMRFGVRVKPRIDFRVGRQPTFTRFSFGWNVPFDTQMARDGDDVRLTFNRASQVDFSAVLADPPPGLKQVKAEENGDKLTVTLTVVPEADVRGFRDDQTYIVDLTVPGAPAQARVLPMQPSAENAAAAREKVDLPGQRPQADAAPQPAPAREVVIKASETVLPPERPAPSPEAKAADAPMAAGSGEMPPDIRETAPGPQTLVRAEAKRIGNVVRVSFPFRDKVASAAFKRGNMLYVVFDSAVPVDARPLRSVLGALASDVTVEKISDGQLLRIGLTDPQLTTLGADGNSWILSIGELVLEPARPIKVERQAKTPGRGLVRVELAAGGLVHTLVDPVVGDSLVVVTAQAPARGLMKPYAFAELDLLPTAHGVAITPRVDDLKVALDAGGISVSRENGLSITVGQRSSGDLSIPKAETRTSKITIDGGSFFTRDPEEFARRQRELIEGVASASEAQRTAARIQLAQFYLAHRFAPEALGILRRASDEDPALTRDPAFITLFAAAQTLTGRTEEGRKALTRGEVAENSDAALWRTIAAAAQGRWDEARGAAGKARGAVPGYPPDIQAMFQLAAAQADVEMNDYAAAQGHLAAIDTTEVAVPLGARFEVLQGRVADAAGRADDALERYTRAAGMGDREVEAEAEYRQLRQRVRDNKIERDEAIKRLQSLTFAWRGDEIELRSLRFLANLQADAGRWREAFSAMRSAIMVGPNAETTRLLQDEMGQQFTSLFLDGKADVLQPLDALTLYYDFRDLTPIGRMGDEIVRKLADRLVAVDLLDQAEELLNHQVDNRLKGAARAQIAADLAVVYLIDRKPDKALAVLNKTRQSGLSASVDRQRRIVEARALADAGRTELSLELAQGLSGADVERLRGDILWKAKRWGEAGERIEAMLAGRWNDPSTLDDQDRQDVLRAAVSYALANDQAGLDRLRGKFQKKMQDSPSARAFDVVTQPIQSMGAEFRDVAKRMAAVDTLRGFVDEYRNQYLKPHTDVKPAPAEPRPEAAKEAPKTVAMNDARPAAKAAPKPDAAPAAGKH